MIQGSNDLGIYGIYLRATRLTKSFKAPVIRYLLTRTRRRHMSLVKSFRFLACVALTAIGAGVFFLTARADQPVPLRLIVVNSATEAAKLEELLKNGADFA